MNIDDGPNPDGTTAVTYYDPRVDPTNGGSAAAVTTFDHYTAYKNRGRGAWMRGANLRLSHALLADNDIGATFAASETFLQDAVIIGESANNATTLGDVPDSRLRVLRRPRGRRARAVRELRVVAGAARERVRLQQAQRVQHQHAEFHGQRDVPNANHVYLENPQADKDGDKAAVFLDGDGA